jgi:arylsulfatase A-like enzyme
MVNRDQYNIALLSIDCLRYDRCGFAGNSPSPTPNLDALANDSLRYRRAYATGPMTPESIPGMIAGLHSHNSAALAHDVALKGIPTNTSTLASWLRDHGYQTHAVVSNSHLTDERGYATGFDNFWNPLDTGNDGDDFTTSSRMDSAIATFHRKLTNQNRILNPYLPAYVLYRYLQSQRDWLTPRANQVTDQLIDQHEQEIPSFVWGHYMDVHAPYHPDTIQQIPTPIGLLADGARASNIQTRWMDGVYDDTVRYVDAQIGRYVDHLKMNDRWDNTILIVTSDHGEALFDRGWFGHANRHYLFDELPHVPLLVRHPDIDAKAIDAPVSIGWLHSLIADLANIQKGDFPSDGLNEWRDIDSTETPPVIIDGVDEQGHTVAALSRDKKYIAQQISEVTPDRPEIWHGDDMAYELQEDGREHSTTPGTKVESSLRRAARDRLCSPDDIALLESELDSATERQLAELGYL